jgi:AMP deaminase
MDSPYALHLAVAALVGASFAAASAYYMHRKTLDQLLRFARDQRRRTRLLPDGGAHGYDLEDAEEDEGHHTPAHRDHDRRTMPIPPGLPPLHTGREGTHPPPPHPLVVMCDAIGAVVRCRGSEAC